VPVVPPTTAAQVSRLRIELFGLVTCTTSLRPTKKTDTTSRSKNWLLAKGGTRSMANRTPMKMKV
jgi:hypothetical protein